MLCRKLPRLSIIKANMATGDYRSRCCKTHFCTLRPHLYVARERLVRDADAIQRAFHLRHRPGGVNG